MRLLFIRHGDPDYERDTLTEKGCREAELLAEIIDSYHIDDVYQSPLGRARDTAAYSCDRLNKKPVTLEWLKEFPALTDPNLSEDVRKAFATELVTDEATGQYRKRIVWDILPSYYMDHPELFDREGWRRSALAEAGNMVSLYDEVASGFDALLADYGYVRKGLVYQVTNSNEKTIAFFCHFGLASLLLSRLCNVSPFVPWHFTAAAPTSVTEAVTEEREKGIAIFRILRAGEITHLRMSNEGPSFSARFCERYENREQRH